jgi:starvation-inducible DNA-binding protein
MNRTEKSSNGGQGGSALATPTDLSENGVKAIAAALNGLAADAFALYLKTKNFHWHMSGPHFRDYHLLLDEHGEQIYAVIDPLAERVRKLGQPTLRSIGHIAKLQSVKDNDEPFVGPLEMLRELEHDNRAYAASLRKAHELCDDNGDVASASLIEVWIDETERRTWFLFEATRGADATGH